MSAHMNSLGESVDSLADGAESPLTDAQKRELDRRVAVLEAGATTCSPWHEVEARILRQLTA